MSVRLQFVQIPSESRVFSQTSLLSKNLPLEHLSKIKGFMQLESEFHIPQAIFAQLLSGANESKRAHWDHFMLGTTYLAGPFFPSYFFGMYGICIAKMYAIYYIYSGLWEKCIWIWTSMRSSPMPKHLKVQSLKQIRLLDGWHHIGAVVH